MKNTMNLIIPLKKFSVYCLVTVLILLSLACNNITSTEITDKQAEELFFEIPEPIEGIPQNFSETTSNNYLPTTAGSFEYLREKDKPDGLYFVPNEGEPTLLLNGLFVNIQLRNGCLYAVSYSDALDAPRSTLYRIDLRENRIERFPHSTVCYYVLPNENIIYWDHHANRIVLTDWEDDEPVLLMEDIVDATILPQGNRVILHCRVQNWANDKFLLYTPDDGLTELELYAENLRECFFRDDTVYTLCSDVPGVAATAYLHSYNLMFGEVRKPILVKTEHVGIKHIPFILTYEEAEMLRFGLEDTAFGKLVSDDLDDDLCLLSLSKDSLGSAPDIYIFEDRIRIKGGYADNRVPLDRGVPILVSKDVKLYTEDYFETDYFVDGFSAYVPDEGGLTYERKPITSEKTAIAVGLDIAYHNFSKGRVSDPKLVSVIRYYADNIWVLRYCRDDIEVEGGITCVALDGATGEIILRWGEE